MFEGWDNFYIIVGPAAGALIGLMFVVVTLTAESEPRGMERGATVYITPIAFHFTVVLVLSALTAVPALPSAGVTAVAGALGLGGAIYALVTLVRLSQMAREQIYQPDLSDRFWYGAFPALVYAGLAVAGVLAFVDTSAAAYLMAAATMTILIIGIRNAWDLVTAIVKTLARKRSEHKAATIAQRKDAR